MKRSKGGRNKRKGVSKEANSTRWLWVSVFVYLRYAGGVLEPTYRNEGRQTKEQNWKEKKNIPASYPPRR